MPKYLNVDSANVVRKSEFMPDKRETITLSRGDELPDWLTEADVKRLEGLGAIADTPDGSSTVASKSRPAVFSSASRSTAIYFFFPALSRRFTSSTEMPCFLAVNSRSACEGSPLLPPLGFNSSSGMA